MTLLPAELISMTRSPDVNSFIQYVVTIYIIVILFKLKVIFNSFRGFILKF